MVHDLMQTRRAEQIAHRIALANERDAEKDEVKRHRKLNGETIKALLKASPLLPQLLLKISMTHQPALSPSQALRQKIKSSLLIPLPWLMTMD